MNTNSITTLTLAGMLVAFSACEGEPPKAPTNPPSVPIAEASEPNAAQAASSSPATSLATNGSGGGATTEACHCPCMPGDAHGMMHGQPSPVASTAELGAGAPAPAAATGAPVPPQATEGAGAVASAHAIVGTVTAVPAREAATAVVYLEDAGIVPKRGELAGIDNHGMAFAPYLTVVTVGGRVVFTNSDPFPHNVFSPDNERFNLGTVQMKGSSAHTFKTAGVYTLLCNLHPNMIGYVVVAPSSYFAKTNAKGQFTIKDVPPGTYKITAWAPRLPTITQPIAVKDADATADFALHR